MSHLDLMRVFARALRRTSIPVAYSEGFNPHAEMVFGLPLQVGVTSSAECLDIKVCRHVDPEEAAAELSSQLPAGLAVLNARERMGKRNIMASITHAAYAMEVGYANGRDGGVSEGGGNESRVSEGRRESALVDAVRAFMLAPEFVIAKETKSGMRDTDIRPLVNSLEAQGSSLRMVVRAGSASNLKPDLVLEALNRIAAPPNVFYRTSLHRVALYIERDGALTDPLDDCSTPNGVPQRGGGPAEAGKA